MDETNTAQQRTPYALARLTPVRGANQTAEQRRREPADQRQLRRRNRPGTVDNKHELMKRQIDQRERRLATQMDQARESQQHELMKRLDKACQKARIEIEVGRPQRR